MEGEQRISPPGDNFTPRGQISPLGSKFAPRGEVKNGPQDTTFGFFSALKDDEDARGLLSKWNNLHAVR
jgi:hypothetical protein